MHTINATVNILKRKIDFSSLKSKLKKIDCKLFITTRPQNRWNQNSKSLSNDRV